MLTVACVYVQGHVPYSPEYVFRLHQMAKRWITRPFRFVALIDGRPWIYPAGLDTKIIPKPRGMKGWWSKLELFNPANAGKLKGRILYLDLDTLIVGNLDPIIDYPAPFALAPHAGSFEGRDGLAVVKRYNSSVMVWDAGTLDGLYRHWSWQVAHRLHGDQDWIGEQVPDAATFPTSWVPRISQLGNSLPSKDAKVVLMKTPKNVQAAKRWPWVREAWGAA